MFDFYHHKTRPTQAKNLQVRFLLNYVCFLLITAYFLLILRILIIFVFIQFALIQIKRVPFHTKQEIVHADNIAIWQGKLYHFPSRITFQDALCSTLVMMPPSRKDCCTLRGHTLSLPGPLHSFISLSSSTMCSVRR